MRSHYAPIKPKDRLYQEIVDQIQERIVTGALNAGDRIPAERELAEQFGVSRTAVREAIKSLTEKGLIEVLVGRGTFVTDLSPQRVIESVSLLLSREPDATAKLNEAREQLEIPIVRLAATRRTAEQLQRLRDLLQEMEASDVSAEDLVAIDDDFHLELARATGNAVLEILSHTIIALLNRERVALSGGGMREGRSRGIETHHRIIRAIESRDAVAAESAVTELFELATHVKTTYERGLVSRELAVAGVAAD
jgi:GntR family transcriptional repressor for pyruvate dehydrogenase complex